MASQPNARDQVGRSMSYRKPVPVYVPSPTIPAKALELEKGGFQSNVPPLPENWREIITTKIQEANSSQVSVHTFQGALTTSQFDPSKSLKYLSPSELVWSECAEEDQKLVTFPPAALKSIHRRHATHGLPTHYRAPTPPLPSSKSSRMSPECQVGAENIASLYNMPSSPGPSLEIAQLPAETRSLRLSSSFQTDRTVVSHGSGRISTPWSRSFGTLAYGGPSNRSLHPKEVDHLSETIDARNGSCSSLLCCGSFGNMIRNLKDLCQWK